MSDQGVGRATSLTNNVERYKQHRNLVVILVVHFAVHFVVHLVMTFAC